LTLTTSPAPSGASTSTTFSDSFSSTCEPGTIFSISMSGAGSTRILRPAVTMSIDPSSLGRRNTPKVAGGWLSFSTSSASASILSRSPRSASASFWFWLVARASCPRVSTSFSSSTATWRGELDSRRRSRPTSSSRNFTWDWSS
jgi:hypothetical protein